MTTAPTRHQTSIPASRIRFDVLKNAQERTGKTNASLKRHFEEKYRKDATKSPDCKAKSIDRLFGEKPAPAFSRSNLAELIEPLGLEVHQILKASSRSTLHLSRPALNSLGYALRCAVWHAIVRGNATIRQPHLAGPVATSSRKITSESLQHDQTHAIDQATREAIFKVLSAAHQTYKCPLLSRGFHVIEEEGGYLNDYVDSGGSALVVFVDSADDTAQAELGLGGSSLVSVYHLVSCYRDSRNKSLG